MIERVVRIGQEHQLVGVLTEAHNAGADPDRPAVILLNAGLIHRVGPHRLHVTLARRLAALGFPTLRLDLGGIGDSDARTGNASFDVGSVADTRTTMDYLEEHRGIHRFILGGLCAGAECSFNTAVEDPRVVGTILLDWYAYRTPRFYLTHFGRRMFRLSAWRGFVSRRLRSRTAAATPDAPAQQADPTARTFPPREESAEHLRAVLERGVRCLAIYTAGQEAVYNHTGQFNDMFATVDLAGARSEYFHESDHTFTLIPNQERLENTVADWITTVDWVGSEPPAPVSGG